MEEKKININLLITNLEREFVQKEGDCLNVHKGNLRALIDGIRNVNGEADQLESELYKLKREKIELKAALKKILD